MGLKVGSMVTNGKYDVKIVEIWYNERDRRMYLCLNYLRKKRN